MELEMLSPETILILQSMISGMMSEIISGGTGLVVGLLIAEFTHRRRVSETDREKEEDWYNNVQGILADATLKTEQAALRSEFDREALANDFEEYSRRLNRKVNGEPSGVPKDVVDSIGELVPIYAKGASVARVTGEKEGYEALAEMFEMAQKEYSDDVDLKSTLEEAEDFSKLLKQLTEGVNARGMDSSEFTNHLEEVLSNYETEEFLKLISDFNDGTGVEDSLSLTNMLFLELSNSISQEKHQLVDRAKRRRLE